MDHQDFVDGQRHLRALFEVTDASIPLSTTRRVLEDYAERVEKPWSAFLKTLVDGDGSNYLHAACQKNNSNLCRFLLEDDKDLVDSLYVPNRRGETPLELALAVQSEAVVDLLLSKCPVEKYFSPLSLRGCLMDEPLLQRVLRRIPFESSFVQENDRSASILSWALFGGKIECTMAIIKWMSPEALRQIHFVEREVPPPVVMAASLPHRDDSFRIVQAIVQRAGPSVIKATEDYRTENGCTCVHNAAEAGHYSLVSWLLTYKEAQDCCKALAKTGSPYAVATSISVRELLEPYTPKDYRHCPKALPATRKDLIVVASAQHEKAMECKIKGNEAFKRGDRNVAADLYEDGLRALIGSKSLTCLDSVTVEPERSSHLVATLLCNLSASQTEESEILRLATLATKFNSKWMKPLYRMACSHMRLGHYEEACVKFHEARLLDPANKQLSDAFAEALRCAREQYHSSKT